MKCEHEASVQINTLDFKWCLNLLVPPIAWFPSNLLALVFLTTSLQLQVK